MDGHVIEALLSQHKNVIALPAGCINDSVKFQVRSC